MDNYLEPELRYMEGGEGLTAPAGPEGTPGYL